MAAVQVSKLDLKSPLLVPGQSMQNNEEPNAQSSLSVSNDIQIFVDHDISIQNSFPKKIWKKLCILTKQSSTTNKSLKSSSKLSPKSLLILLLILFSFAIGFYFEGLPRLGLLMSEGLSIISFNYFNNDITSDTVTRNWMSRMPDDILLSQMTIPGTHNSASFMLEYADYDFFDSYFGDERYCQSRSIEQQLEDGIRFFDFHGRAGGTNTINFCYGDRQDPDFRYDFGSALNEMAKFLESYPTETIIIIPQCDDLLNDCRDFQPIWNTVYGLYNKYSRPYTWYKKSEEFPTLGDVRGKLVLLSREDPPLAVPEPARIKVWKDNTHEAGAYPYQIQDWYIVREDGIEKIKTVEDAIDKALKDPVNEYWLNFLSCVPNVDDENGLPIDIAGIINDGHSKTLMRRPFGRLGILIMDFYEMGEDASNNVLAQISSNTRLQGTLNGWYSLHNEEKGDKVLDSNIDVSQRVYLSNNQDYRTYWRIVKRDKNGWFNLYNRHIQGFLDGGGNYPYVRESPDYDISNHAKWRLVPIPDSIYFLMQNYARLLRNDTNQYLAVDSDFFGPYPFMSSLPNKVNAHWRFQRIEWDYLVK